MPGRPHTSWPVKGSNFAQPDDFVKIRIYLGDSNMKYRTHVIWLSISMLGFVGCAQAGTGVLPLIITGLLLSFGTVACQSDDDCRGEIITTCSQDGELTESCCPAGVACNYLPYNLCADGSCVDYDVECTPAQ
jgi:hypothetical protein